MPSLADYHAPYPEAAPGQERKVIYLPPLDSDLEQQHMRVQLIPGRHEDCEDGRLYHLTGTIAEGTVEGWGYDYYVVTLGDIYAAHRSPADPENASTFVAMYENPIIRYNSKLPIVVYVPEGAEVRYRVWMDEAGRVAHAAGAPATAAAAAEAPDADRNYADMEELDTDNGHGVKVQEYAEEAPAASRGIPQLSDHEDVPREHTQTTEAYEEVNHSAEAPRQRGIPTLSNEEEEARQAQGQAQRSYVEDTNAAPALRASEKKADPQDADGRHGHHKSDPTSEHRRRSSSKPRKHSASENGAPKSERPRGLSATEASPGDHAAAAKSASERSPSATKHDKRGSNDKSANNDSTTSARRSSVASNKDKDGAYEKKAKNFWNRARGNSKSKSPKKSDGKDGQWSEM